MKRNLLVAIALMLIFSIAAIAGTISGKCVLD